MNTTEVRANTERSSKASRAGALHSHIQNQRQHHETPSGEARIHRLGPNARMARIAATDSHSPVPTMDDASGVIGGGR